MWTTVSPAAARLVRDLLMAAPQNRLSAQGALASEWFQRENESSVPLALASLAKLKGQSQLRKAVISYTGANDLRQDEERLRELFTTFDADHDGYISAADMAAGYAAIHGDVARAHTQAATVVQAVKDCTDEYLSLAEFLVAQLKLHQTAQERKLHDAFMLAATVFLPLLTVGSEANDEID